MNSLRLRLAAWLFRQGLFDAFDSKLWPCVLLILSFAFWAVILGLIITKS